MSRERILIDPYQAVSELPSAMDLKNQIDVFKPFAWIIDVMTGKDLTGTVTELEDELKNNNQLGERFYTLLGERNWVLHGKLNTKFLEKLLDDATTPELAERMLIEHYKDVSFLNSYISYVEYRPEMGGRLYLIERAKEDYIAGRYDAVVLRLIAVLDGFVNDFDTSQRCGLHARQPEEMVGFDCLGGHYMGLSHAIETFQKPFRKRVDDEVFEVYRNGIVHGMVTSYNNDVVASKAWNYLFSVVDWADSFKKRAERERAQSEKPKKTLCEVLRDFRSSQMRQKEFRKKQDAWVSHIDVPDEKGCAPEPWNRTIVFMDTLEKGQVGPLSSMICCPKDNPKSYIDTAKRYLGVKFDKWRLVSIEHRASAIAVSNIELSYNGNTWMVSIQWVKYDAQGKLAAEFEDGEWIVMSAWQRLGPTAERE